MAAKLAELDEAVMRLLSRKALDSLGRPTSNDYEADEVLVRVVSHVLRTQLTGRRRKGLAGWHANNQASAKLRNELAQHVHEGNWVEAIRVAAALYGRDHLYGPGA